MTISEKFRVKDDLTTVYTLESPIDEGDFIVWWIDENGSRRSVEYSESTINRHLESRNWILVDKPFNPTLDEIFNYPFPDTITPYDIDPPKKTKSDGGSSSYYELTITNKAGESIKCETGDVIRTLVGNDFDFGNCVKALRRMYLATLGMGKEGTDLVYDANKIRWFLGEIERVNK